MERSASGLSASHSAQLLNLQLGELDITSDHVSLAGLAEELDALNAGSLIDQVLDGGTDPREAVAQYDAKLSSAEVDAIQDYVTESDNLITLQGEIVECDGVLGAIEELLSRYASDLAAISTDIRALQEQSQAMNVKLRNRRSMQTGLSDFVERVALLPSLVRSVMEAPADGEDFSNALRQLASKLDFVAKDQDVRRSAAFRDVAPELEKLRLAAVTRCRELLLAQIYGLRRPRAHIQAKQAALLRHRQAAAFLRAHGGDIYLEVRSAYAFQVSSKLLDIFRSYWAAMERAETTVATADDLLGSSDSSNAAAVGVAGVLSMLSFSGGGPLSPSRTSGGHGGGSAVSGQSQRGKADVFALGDRGAVLAALDSAPLILHETEAAGRKFPFEVLFRSLTKLLVDAAGHEFLFCCDFWGAHGRSVFHDTFDPVVSFVQASLAAEVQELHDAVALLLCIRLNREYSLQMARKAIPALDGHFDALNLRLWPQLKTVLDAQMASLKQVTPDGSDLTATRVHAVTARYAALTAAVLSLHADFLDGPLVSNIERMRYAVMNLLLTLSRAFPQRGRGTVFLIHNFSHVVATLKDAAARALPAPPQPRTPTPQKQRASAAAAAATAAAAAAQGDTGGGGGGGAPGLGPAGDDVLAAFEESLSRASSLYVDARLTAGAPQLVSFVQRGEAAAARLPEGQPIPGFGPELGAPVAKDFSSRWERVVEVLNREIGQDFGPSAAGRAVQQAAFTQLLMHWSRFLELLKRQGEAGAEVARGAVSMAAIMYQLKQHRLG